MNEQAARRAIAVAAGEFPARARSAAVWIVFAIGFLVAFHAQAQAPAGDPPGRVARLSEVDGQVWRYSTETNEWVSAARNRPLTSGDHIATDNGAAAEVTLGTTHLRLDAATELEIVQLDDRRFVVHLVGGSVAARLRTPQAVAEFELDSDEGQFHAQAAGRYRFDRQQQASDLTVYAGRAVFDGANSELPVASGQHAQFWLDRAGAPQYTLTPIVRDAFFALNDERDRAEDRIPPVRYVSPEMTGAEDLDRYGAWEQTPDYGAVWTPRAVDADWAPYRTGHWAVVQPWGWTWVDDAPWGFAPFHYGRWVRYHEAWCWAPGTYVARPVYAPALVAWIGGPRVGVSVSLGGGGAPVGWFPLAPHEVYVPSYRSSETYVRNVNITHVTNVTNITTIVNNERRGGPDPRDFANRRFPNAVTVVPANVMTSRQPIGPAAAQYRERPEVRALVAEARPAPAMLAPPVSAPPPAARTGSQTTPPRPPMENRGSGNFAGRPEGPRPGERGLAPRPAIGARPPTTMDASGRNTSPSLPTAQGNSAQPATPSVAQRPSLPATPSPREPAPVAPAALPPAAAVVRPPRGGIGREPAAADPATVQRPEAAATQRAIPPSPIQQQRTMQVNEPPPRARADSIGAARVVEPQRALEPQRFVEPPQRPAPTMRPQEPVRAQEPARAIERPAMPQPNPSPPQQQVRPAPVAAELRGARAEAPKQQPQREERRDDKRDPNDKQQQR